MMEEWRPIDGFPDYEVSNRGRVRSFKFGRVTLLTPQTHDKWGYQRISMRNPEHVSVSQYLHRVVLIAFVGQPPEGYECRHLDNNPRNNDLENVCWGTISENRLDKRANGTSAPWNSKLTHCKHGHEFTSENTYWRVDSDGYRGRQCRLCRQISYQSRGPCRETGCETKWRRRGLCAKHLNMDAVSRAGSGVLSDQDAYKNE